MALLNEPAEIGLLLYPGVQLAAVYGLSDLFAVASRLAAAHGGADAPQLRVSHWRPEGVGHPEGVARPEDATGNVVCVFDTHPGPRTRPAVLILPPSLEAPPSPEVTAALARWLAARHGDGAVLCSVCAGVFLLAETGLLAGRNATTHWGQASLLAQRFPDIRIHADKLLVDDGDIITAGGVMAWTDLGLKLVERMISPTIMLETARFLLLDPPGREQRYYSSFSPRLRHGDEAVLKVQHWLQAHGAREVSLPDMARHAGLEERTFLRRFRKATGLKPTEYCQQLRVGKARELLELTNHTVDKIAWDVGYADPGAFRKLFVKLTGLTPGDYRRRFGVTGNATAAV